MNFIINKINIFIGFYWKTYIPVVVTFCPCYVPTTIYQKISFDLWNFVLSFALPLIFIENLCKWFLFFLLFLLLLLLLLLFFPRHYCVVFFFVLIFSCAVGKLEELVECMVNGKWKEYAFILDRKFQFYGRSAFFFFLFFFISKFFIFFFFWFLLVRNFLSYFLIIGGKVSVLKWWYFRKFHLSVI